MEDVFLDDRPVQVVRAVAQRHLRQLHAQAHPVGGDVIEVVEVDAAHGEGAQRVEARGRRLHRDVVVLWLIRQRREAAMLWGETLKVSANHLNANRLGGLMKCNSVSRKVGVVFARVGIILKTMTATLKNLAETVEELPAKDRIFLAERLLVSLEEADLEQQWTDEALRRRDEVRSGKVRPVPAAEVYRRIERLLAK